MVLSTKIRRGRASNAISDRERLASLETITGEHSAQLTEIFGQQRAQTAAIGEHTAAMGRLSVECGHVVEALKAVHTPDTCPTSRQMSRIWPVFLGLAALGVIFTAIGLWKPLSHAVLQWLITSLK